MNLSVPLYVEESAVPAGTQFSARPLFAGEPHRMGDRLPRLLSRISSDLRREYGRRAREARHEEWLGRIAVPAVEEQWISIRIERHRGTAHVSLLLVLWDGFGRRMAMVAARPEICFEVGRGQDPAERAEAVVQRYFREREARSEGEEAGPAEIFRARRAWVTHLDLSVEVPGRYEVEKRRSRALVGEAPTETGLVALERVGRCLNLLYPDELETAGQREAVVEELIGLVAGPDRRPVVLVGPRLSGKTVVVHEALRRVLTRRAMRVEAGERGAPSRQWWQIAPARLISGMSYLGQWEQRVLAILQESKRRDHLLYLDDLPGLYLAGISAHSSLSVAHVMKPWIERREVRFLGEATPEAWRVLRERDRGFADLFQVLPVPELGITDTLRCLIAVQRSLEERNGCTFGHDALPAVLDLLSRHGGDAAFPGKAAAFLRQLAQKRPGSEIRRAEVLAEFQERTGLAPFFVDRRRRLPRDQVFQALARRVIGQERAVAVAADAIALARARLNDPGRPLASLLFLGPTGVGKTECAKALAAVLFGDAERLVRFDMNEFATPSAVMRLTGTRESPEGLLAGAVRRQPFSVVLFDEIEKADPRAHDLLLAVLGEGRLTDALGRTASFAGCLIVMTSNLGASEARHRLGFGGETLEDSALYLAAARAFFRPEFFNRIDRLVPFHPLGRATLSRIARAHLDDVLGRHGLHQRRCIVQIGEDAVDHLIVKGTDPNLGARALKREVERAVAQPLARRLVETVAGDALRIEVMAGGGDLQVTMRPLRAVPTRPRPALLTTADEVAQWERLESVLARLNQAVKAREPSGPLAMDALNPEHLAYFAAREQERRIGEMLRRRTGTEPPVDVALVGTAGRRSVGKMRRRWGRSTERGMIQRIQADAAFQLGLQDLGTTVVDPRQRGRLVTPADLVPEISLLQHLVECDGLERLELEFLVEGADPGLFVSSWLGAYEACFSGFWGFRWESGLAVEEGRVATARVVGRARLEGPGARVLIRGETGMQLYEAQDGRVTLLRIRSEPAAERESWESGLGLVREFRANGGMVDHGSGDRAEGEFGAALLRRWVLQGLPVPEEFRGS